MKILLPAATSLAGFLTIAWSLSLFFKRKVFAEKIFSDSRPIWLSWLSWAYLTLTGIAWVGFFQLKGTLPFFAAGIVTLMTFKFIFFFLSYNQWQRFFVLLWKHRLALIVVSMSSSIVGLLMIYTALFLL